MKEKVAAIIGRKCLESELSTELRKEAWLQKYRLPAMQVGKAGTKCRRCGQIDLFPPSLAIMQEGKPVVYCRFCIQFGRVRSDDFLMCIPLEKSLTVTQEVSCSWHGNLSSQQQRVSQRLIEESEQAGDFLIWAVTGAGKTEMLFGLIEKILRQNGTIGIAAPRIDVCLELFPRLCAAFQAVDVQLLYGKQAESYRYTPLVICTTHQLVRFYRFFDCLVIDEVDSFPFVGNQLLAQAVEDACKPSGKRIFLTATPDVRLRQRLTSGALRYEKVPQRFHQKLLVVPTFYFIPNLHANLQKGKIPHALLVYLKRMHHRRILLFVPSIYWLERLCTSLAHHFPAKRIACVHANHPQREALIAEMRHEKIDWLVTTTILERGVTFRDIDVCVLGASHQQFQATALVQISGRVGRHPDFAAGFVSFFHQGVNREMREAKGQIEEMNRLALLEKQQAAEG